MDINEIATSPRRMKRELNGKVRVYVDPTIVMSAADKASAEIEAALAAGRCLTMDINAIKAAPTEIGAGRGRKASEVEFIGSWEGFSPETVLVDSAVLQYFTSGTRRAFLSTDFTVDGSTEKPTQTAARHIVKAFKDAGWRVSVRPDADGVKYLDVKVRGPIVVTETTTETQPETEEAAS